MALSEDTHKLTLSQYLLLTMLEVANSNKHTGLQQFVINYFCNYFTKRFILLALVVVIPGFYNTTILFTAVVFATLKANFNLAKCYN